MIFTRLRKDRNLEELQAEVDRAAAPPRAAPPGDRRTLADYSLAEARRFVERKPHVVIREDPMFGRRGYAREVLPEPSSPSGYLVLVIAFISKKDESGRWVEPFKPRDCDRRFWEPGKVELI